MLTRETLLTIAFALPLSAIAIVAVTTEVADQVNPCVRWNPPNFDNYRTHAGNSCAEVKVRGETRAGSLLRMAAVPGAVILAGTVAVLGAVRRRPWFIFLAACLMFVEAVPLALTLWPLALLTGAGFLYTANRTRVSWTGSS